MRRSVSMLALCALAGPAFAQMEAADVWEDLRTGAEAWGYTVDAAAVDIGEDEVTVTEMTLSFVSEVPGPEDAEEDFTVTTEIVMTLPTLRIVEEGEAALIELPAAMPFRVTGTNDLPDGGPSSFGGTLGQEGLRLSVAARDEAKVYSYDAAAITLTVDEIEDDTAPDTFEVAARMEDVTGDTRTSEDAQGRRVSEQTFGAARMTIGVDISDTSSEDPGTLALAAAYSDLSGDATAALPQEVDMSDLAAALGAGMDVVSNLSIGQGRTEMEFDSPESSFSYASNTEGGTFAVELSPDVVRYEITSEGSNASVVGSDIPVPEIAYGLDSARFAVVLPPLAADEAQPFGFEMAMRGLELNESLWSLFDPQEVLARDPANVVIELSGNAVFAQGLMDMSAASGGPDATPELVDLDVEAFEISLAGAAILGTAMFAGTPDGAPIAPGLPPLEGRAELSATGINALVDGLTQLGFLPPQQGAMVRGMLGFIARPTGDDSYATEIEIGPNGLTANGVPLQ